jgi:hypothetical protein
MPIASGNRASVEGVRRCRVFLLLFPISLPSSWWIDQVRKSNQGDEDGACG